MIDLIQDIFRRSAETKLRAVDEICSEVASAAELLAAAYGAGGKSIIFGNGGSAADAQHYAAELTGRFQAERRALPAIALTVDTSALTSIGNDYGFERVFSRQLEAFAQPGDVVIGISTSGNSPNVLRAIERAREMDCRVIGLSGRDGGAMRSLCDVCVVAPSQVTARIQEVHITVLHIWCELIEMQLFGA